MKNFQTPKAKELIVERFEFNTQENSAKFYFSLDKEIFCEKLVFQLPFKAEKIKLAKLEKALFFAHLALSISYWKIKAPPLITVKSGFLKKIEINFFQQAFTKGLGEFFYENNINFKGLINFKNFYSSSREAKKNHHPFKEKIIKENFIKKKSTLKNISNKKNLLCLGGGKDSLVGSEILRQKKIDFIPLIFAENFLAITQAKKMNLPMILIKRNLDKKIFSYNKSKKYFNGHVPFSFILAFCSNIAANLMNAKNIIVSNEHSANFGNINFCGQKINHQWSKSYRAEKMMNKVLHKNFSINYFSLLRPFWEIKIVEMFVKQKKYLYDFASCNQNFKQNKKTTKSLHCGHCPKCVFVFSLLAAFVKREKLKQIFKQNLFEKQNLLLLFQRLWGEKDFKPFECVGEKSEVKAALTLAIKKYSFNQKEIILQNFAKKFLNNEKKKQKEISKAQEILSFFGPCNPLIKDFGIK